ncbi:uncharacterized protein METZ01_LOCUS210600, partial [marine metagenome]
VLFLVRGFARQNQRLGHADLFAYSVWKEIGSVDGIRLF